MAKAPKKKAPPSKSKTGAKTRPRKVGSAPPLPPPGDYPMYTMLYSNGDDAWVAIRPPGDGDTLRSPGGVPTWVPWAVAGIGVLLVLYVLAPYVGLADDLAKR